MSEAEDKQDSPTPSTEPFATASFKDRSVKVRGEIGPYRVLRTLGEGGYGIVFLAEQKEPVKRQVALKVIKPGMDTRQVIARFEAERQALALLDHPNIAHVFDAGTTQHGRPYFVMEHVKGIPITEYCDRERLSIEDRLRLFSQVCDAIQHAHQKGIIHRDIKPSNILVTIHEDKPLPVVIDFGVAKAISQPLTEHTLFTEAGQMLGTPAYMSPEQAEMTNQDIDTRSDVYSLGVVLYELLAGALPFDESTLRQAAIGEIQRIIREEEPLRLSIRLRRVSAEEPTRLAQQRRTDIRTLERQLHGDLDWITLKTMEKDRTRRYETAHALAQDIERHLKHEPVIAGPPSTVYRFKKFVRRNRASVTTAVAVAATIVVGLVVATTLYFQAQHAWKRESVARAEAMAARDEAKQAEKVAQQQRRRAERLLARAQLERGVRLLNEGNCLGLLDLLEARTTADEFPDLGGSAARLWAIGYAIWSDRLVHLVRRASEHNLAFSPAGRFFVTSEGETAQLWETTTGQLHGPPLQLGKTIGAVVFSPDGRLLATHSVEGVARLWETATGQPMGPILQHEGGADESSEEADRAWWAAAFNPAGKLLATASIDGSVRLWETDTGQSCGEPLQHEGEVWAVAFSPDGRLLASGSRDKTAQLWEVPSGRPHGPPLRHKGWVEKVAFSPDGKLLATMATDGTVSFWKTDTGRIYNWLRHDGLADIAFSPNGKLLASASGDGTVQMWDARTGQTHLEPLHHDDLVSSVTFSPDGRLLATSSADHTVRLWEVASGQPYGQPLRHPGEVRSVVFSPDGNFLASSGPGEGQTTRIWRTYQKISTQVVAYQSGLQLGAISPDGKIGALISGDTVHLWDTTTLKTLGEPLHHDAQVKTVVFSTDGKLLASGLSGAIHSWDVASGRRHGPPFKTEWTDALALSSDGKLLATASPRNWYVRVFDLAAGRCLHTLYFGGGLCCVALSPDGEILAAGSGGGVMRLWDVPTEQQLGPSLRHRGPVWAMAFSPDGNSLATISGKEDRTVRFWDVDTGPPYYGLVLPHQIVHGKAVLESFSSDGTFLVGRLPEGKARVWCVPVALSDLREMQLRTWIALGEQRSSQGEAKAILWREWQKLREELHFFEVRGLRASWPEPANGADVSADPDVKLRWIPGLDAVAHNVYFGTNPGTLRLLGKVEVPSYADLPPLERHRWYCWRVDGINPDGSVVKGNLWSFSTGRLLAWWKFDEGSGTTALDSSGQGNHGTLIGGAEWIDAYQGDGVKLDGSDDYVTLPIGSVISSLTSATFTTWVDVAEVGGAWQRIFDFGSGTTVYMFLTPRAGSGGPMCFAITIGGGGASEQRTTAPDTLSSGWHHVAVTIDADTHTNVLYLDGVAIADTTGATLTPSSLGNTTNNWLGRSQYASDAYLNASLDDFRIYSYALGEADIKAVYAGEGPGPVEKPVWVVDVSDEEYAPPETETERDDEYYVPLRSELELKEAEQTLGERLEITSQVEISNPAFGGTNGTKVGNSSGNVPDAWRAFAEGGAVKIRIVQLPVSELFPGSPATGAVLLRVTTFGRDQGFDNDGARFPLSPGSEYYAEFYAKTGNEDGSVQTFNFSFPLFGASGYLNREPGAMSDCKATGEWQHFVGPRFRDLEATRGHLAWRCIDDGGDNSILIALPAVQFVLSSKDASVNSPAENDNWFAYVPDIGE